MIEYDMFSPEELRFNDYKISCKYPVGEKPSKKSDEKSQSKLPDSKQKPLLKNESKHDESDAVTCPICLESIYKVCIII